MPNIPDRIAWTVDLLDPQPDDTILEVGCGNGAAVSLIAPRLQTGVITAIDRCRPRHRCEPRPHRPRHRPHPPGNPPGPSARRGWA
jgi:hypothetical protein